MLKPITDFAASFVKISNGVAILGCTLQHCQKDFRSDKQEVI